MVENGNQGLTADEIMQKKREEFFSKRIVTTTVKTRFSNIFSFCYLESLLEYFNMRSNPAACVPISVMLLKEFHVCWLIF